MGFFINLLQSFLAILYWWVIPFSILIGIAVFAALWKRRKRKAYIFGLLIFLGLVSALLVRIYYPYVQHRVRATRGDAAATYELARWYENRSDSLAALPLVLVLPRSWIEPDVVKGYQQALKAGYIPTVPEDKFYWQVFRR